MEYTVSKLGRISGVSARTLRYYDEINLLQPKRVNSSGYRIYGQNEVNVLQQILFYRELEMSLDEIKKIVHSESFDIENALNSHLIHLNQQRKRLDDIISTVEKSIQDAKGEVNMNDQEKFEAFKKEQIKENENQYGEEIREKYGRDVIDQSNEKFVGMSEAEYRAFEQSIDALNQKLAEATRTSKPDSELGQEVARLHQEWLRSVWPDNHYSEEAHFNLSVMYVQDERFKAYYEEVEPGAAEFLHEAVKIYLEIEE